MTVKFRNVFTRVTGPAAEKQDQTRIDLIIVRFTEQLSNNCVTFSR